ncbi:MAG: methyltransferase [Hyphomicrobium sp.]
MSSAKAPGQTIVDLAFGFILSGALATAAKLKIADRLEAGPKTLEALAKETGMHAQSLHRVLRMLASFGIFKEDDHGSFHQTPESDLLRTSLPHTLHHAALMITQDIFWKPVGQLDEVVRTGENGMVPIFGAPFFDYLESNKEAGATFHRGMSSLSDLENAPLAGAYDWSGINTIIDVAGGHGGLLIEALKRAPAAKGILYDVGHVLKDARVNEEKGRWSCVEGDFFKSAPSGGDAYLLKRIIHDWKDEDCVTILSNIRKVMNPGARVLVFDCVIPPGNDPHGGKVLDVLMMSALPGFERTEKEFAALFQRAGLKLTRVIQAPALLSITEAVAV